MINSDEIKKVYPLRDKKRSNTRATLIKTCNKMIIEKGYKNMTMQAVADEAGIHVQTLYKHFSTKFDLASVAGCQALREIMENRNSDTLNIWEAYVMSNAITISQYNKGAEFIGTIELALNSQQSEQLTLAVASETIEILTENLAIDLSMDKYKDLLPSIIGNLLYTASTHNTLSWYRSGGEKDLVELTKNMFLETFKLIEAIRFEYKFK